MDDRKPIHIVVEIRKNHLGLWEKRVPKSSHPLWRQWQPIPAANIDEYRAMITERHITIREVAYGK